MSAGLPGRTTPSQVAASARIAAGVAPMSMVTGSPPELVMALM